MHEVNVVRIALLDVAYGGRARWNHIDEPQVDAISAPGGLERLHALPDRHRHPRQMPLDLILEKAGTDRPEDPALRETRD